MNKLKHYAKEIISFIVILTVLANVVSYFKGMDLNKNTLQLNELVLLDNSKYTIPKNKAVLVHFWATWCPICKVEASNIQTISENFEVLSIAVESGSNKEIRAYMKEHDVNFKVYHDENSTLAQKFNIQVYPTSLIFDKDKNLVFSDVGYTSTIGLYLRMLWANL